MGLSGDEYDKYNPDFTPNKDRRMHEWQEKRKKEREEKSKEIARGEAEEAARREDKERPKPYLEKRDTPPPVTPRTDHFKKGHSPETLFDENLNPNF